MSLHTQYWDSGVFCAYFNDESDRADVVEKLLNDGVDGRLTIITSSFACVEVLKMKDHTHLSKKDENTISDFFEYPFIKMVDATRAVCESARHLIWKHHGLKPKDAVHMASAMAYVEREYLDVLFSYDTDFLSLDGALTQKFHIKEPYIEQLPLFPDTKLDKKPKKAEPQDLL
jgi:predicted nucleic acid-binding protein